MSERLRLLISAYACKPGEGSEPGIGWNWVRQAARFHQVWVITRASNRASIEAALVREPLPAVSFHYYDLPRWGSWWKNGRRGVHLYYYLWQLGAYRLARRLHDEVHFQAAHHVTLGAYWLPSLLARLPVPYVWGPVGGGESGPPAFRQSLGWRGWIYEAARDLAQWCFRLDPFVRRTARRAVLGLAATAETANEMRRLGCPNVVVMAQSALPAEEARRLALLPSPLGQGFRVISLGVLMPWKGFGLGLRAFAEFQRRRPGSEYWIVGDGPERRSLEKLARRLGVAPAVRFWGALPRAEALDKLAQVHVLLHPSLHDSGGWVCLEALAAGRPVVCLDLGGPGLMVTPETGIKVAALSPEQAVPDLAAALEALAADPERFAGLAAAGRRRVAEHFTWDGCAEVEEALYRVASEARAA